MASNLINIVDAFKTIADNHLQIHSFGFGNIAEIATSGTINYPLLYVEADGLVAKKGEVGFKFKLLIMDIVDKDKTNEKDILNDTSQILLDIFSEFYIGGFGYGQDYGFELRQNDIAAVNFLDRFDEEVAGWEAGVTIWSPFNWNRCAIPKT